MKKTSKKNKMACQGFENIIYCVHYIFLVIISATILIQGPFTEWSKGQTTISDNHLHVEDLPKQLPMPSLMICRSPMDKHKDKYHQFMTKGKSQSFVNQTEFEEMRDDTFYTGPDDIVHAMSASVHSGSGVLTSSSDIVALQEPYIKVFPVDFMYLGYCPIIDFEAIRNLMIQKGLMTDKINQKIILKIFLKVC